MHSLLSNILFAFVVLAGCASGPSVPRETLVANLSSAMSSPVSSSDESAHTSRVVQDAVDADALQGMRRHEVEEQLGRGDECSRHPRCGELGFGPHDWYYNVGAMGEGYGGPVPALIIGFDREAKVDRVWNLRTHE